MFNAFYRCEKLGRSDLTVRCWDQFTEETSFTRRPGSVRPRQTSRRENRHIIRHACAEPTDAFVAVQRQAEHSRSLRFPEPSRSAWLKDIWYRGAHYVCCE
ncbi:uncharacterized protein TNCV_1180901 [Trichonephila clavipes]|nr:uncharacterized protein TNCV_1180901 [Trichonephila clavipes]